MFIWYLRTCIRQLIVKIAENTCRPFCYRIYTVFLEKEPVCFGLYLECLHRLRQKFSVNVFEDTRNKTVIELRITLECGRHVLCEMCKPQN